MTTLKESVSEVILNRVDDYEASGAQGQVALSVVMLPKLNQRWVIRQDPAALRDVYGDDIHAAACGGDVEGIPPPEGSEEETAIINAINTKYIDGLSRIIQQCQMHANLVNKRLEFHTMLEQLEGCKLSPSTADRGVKRGSCYIENLPSDCWSEVAEYLSFSDILHLPVVSRQLFDDRDIVTWNTLFIRCFGSTGIPLNADQTWCKEFKNKVTPMIASTYGQQHKGLPGVSRFLEEVAPKGSFRFGKKNLLITRTDPLRMIQAARHGSQTVKLEVDEIATSRGNMLIVTAVYNADGFSGGLHFGTFNDPKTSIALRKAVASVHSVPTATTEQRQQ